MSQWHVRTATVQGEFKMSGLTPTQRTLRELRQRGCICGIVERFNHYAGPFGIRQDLFGFVDIIALYPDGICAIQSCGQSFSEHDKKILDNETAPEWMKSGGIIELWGWRKLKLKRGGKAERWVPRVKRYTIDQLSGEFVEASDEEESDVHATKLSA